jgi:hypothetical protein
MHSSYTANLAVYEDIGPQRIVIKDCRFELFERLERFEHFYLLNDSSQRLPSGSKTLIE